MDSALAKINSRNGNGLTENLVTALRIFRPPIFVTVTHQNGNPSHVSSQQRNRISADVLWAAGPWRCSGDWWEQDAWVRDEWDIAVQGKTGIVLYRLVHDMLTGRWMLEGSYD
jgi:protein ImuB